MYLLSGGYVLSCTPWEPKGLNGCRMRFLGRNENEPDSVFDSVSLSMELFFGPLDKNRKCFFVLKACAGSLFTGVLRLTRMFLMLYPWQLAES